MKPASLSELLELLERHGDDARILAGGQSLMPALNMRLASPRVLVDINGLDTLSGIDVAEGRVTIGALTRHSEIEHSEAIAKHLPLLHHAIGHVAHPAIRNRGTFGGSLAYADPAAELPACALALDATIRIASRRGERTMRAAEFFVGLYETGLRTGEVLIAAQFPAHAEGCRTAFHELARRHGDYPIVGLAARANAAAGKLSDVRLAYFGAGETPVLARGASAVLESAAYSGSLLAQAQSALEQDLSPFGDAVCSAATRKHLARVLLGRVASQLVGGAS